ncbi:MAG: chemotaxis response regulator protein-glutamate methylesterase [Planctomycetota bacterium]
MPQQNVANPAENECQHANPVRVLVVDDSALMRKHLSAMLSSSPRIDVCGIARDGAEAISQIRALSPDVITLDIEMPGKSGLEILPEIFKVQNARVIVVSSFTQRGAQITLDALELGAIDYVGKPSSPIAAHVQQVRDELVEKVLAASRATFPRPRRSVVPPRGELCRKASNGPGMCTAPAEALKSGCVAIGISTGGPPALTQVLAGLNPPVPPIVIVQHMPREFTGPFARRLDSLCAIEVREAQTGDELLPNRALIAPGGRHVTLRKELGRVRVLLNDGEAVSGHKPSVDVLFRSAADIYGEKLIGVIMTGMGRDGADGCKEILAQGGRTFGQDEATSVVYGMNKIAFQEGGVQRQFPLESLAGILMRATF